MALEWSRATVTIDPPGQAHTIDNLMNAIDSFLIQTGWVEPGWSTDPDSRYFVRTDVASRERWQYVGDGPLQAVGIRISKEETDTEVWVTSFLENTAGTAAQIGTRDFVQLVGAGNQNEQSQVVIAFDTTVPNNYLFIGGEDGFYVESGRDGQNNNLGHGMVFTFAAIPELNATRDNLVQQTCNGLIMDLGDQIRGAVTRAGMRFTEVGDNRFVTNDGTNRNFSTYLLCRSSRGISDVTTPGSPTDGPRYRMGARDSVLGVGQGFDFVGKSDIRWGCTFGLMNTPEDDRFRMSPILVLQETIRHDVAVQSTSASNTIAPNTALQQGMDIRHFRQALRIVAIDYTLIPWINVTDAATGTVYRVAEVPDNGRIAKLGIEWPASSITVSIV